MCGVRPCRCRTQDLPSHLLSTSCLRVKGDSRSSRLRSLTDHIAPHLLDRPGDPAGLTAAEVCAGSGSADVECKANGKEIAKYQNGLVSGC